MDPGISPTFTATGGTTTTYADPTGQIWKSHKFTASGSLIVTDVGGSGGGIEYLVVGGGGGGGASGTS